ncbi:MAG: DUF3795 domain-containing protein [Candidatus Hodarchaeales archaeon]|jgi:hypothetical protein
MSENIAYCGLDCSQCPAFIAKQTNDQGLREKTAKEWSGGGFVVSAEQVNCDGCHEAKNNFFHCTQCAVRNCASEKGMTTCAECNEYPCADKLEALWNQLNVPHAKQTLEKLRN